VRAALAISFSVFLVACSDTSEPTPDASGVDAPADTTVPTPDAAGDAGAQSEAAPPPPACDVIGDASFPDAYYPSVNVACTKAGDPCALPPSECVFDRYRIRYTKGYCSSSLTCIFTYTREMCGGAEPVGCEAGICTCGP